MPNIKDWEQSAPIKILFIGNSGAGKTGALTPLVKQGYKIRILDMDNGLDALVNHTRAECPDKLGNIDYMTFRDEYTTTAQGVKVKGAPKAYIQAVGALDKWEDGTKPAEWGTDTIFVLDSLTSLGFAAYQWSKGMNPTYKEKRLWYTDAQESVETVIANLTGDSFKANVVVISHVDVREQDDGTVKGFASAIGRALGPKLPRYFNTLALSETKGSGSNVKRRIKTLPTSLIDLKNPAPMRVQAEYPIETGLADLFRDLRSQSA